MVLVARRSSLGKGKQRRGEMKRNEKRGEKTENAGENINCGGQWSLKRFFLLISSRARALHSMIRARNAHYFRAENHKRFKLRFFAPLSLSNAGELHLCGAVRSNPLNATTIKRGEETETEAANEINISFRN